MARAGGSSRARRATLSRAQRGAFLDQLAATCDVLASATAAGVAPGAVHALRRRDAAFAAGWGGALLAGYEMLETRLLGQALAGHAVDVDVAVKLLAARRGSAAAGKAGRGAAEPRRPTAAETNAALLKRLRVVEARRGIGEAPHDG